MASTFANTRTVTVDGSPLTYRELGEGEAVVLVHGAVSDLRTWDGQLAAIGGSYRAVAYSCRYARPNDPMPAGTADLTRRHAEDLVAFIQSIGAAPAHLVGHSSGALVCLLAAVEGPELVRTLTLEEPPAMTLLVSPQPGPVELLKLARRRPRAALAIAKLGAGALGPAQLAFRLRRDSVGMRVFLRGVAGRAHARRWTEDRHRQGLENIDGLKATLLGGGLPELEEEDVRGISAPTLLLLGEESPMFSRRMTERLEELLPDATRVAIPRASHFGHETNPSAFNRALLGFLASTTASRVALR